MYIFLYNKFSIIDTEYYLTNTSTFGPPLNCKNHKRVKQGGIKCHFFSLCTSRPGIYIFIVIIFIPADPIFFKMLNLHLQTKK